MRALVLDDHSVARRGLRAILREAFRLEEIGETSTGTEAIALARQLRPDLVLVDLHLPRPPPATVVCAQIRALLPRSRIVVVTAFESAREIKECLALGADGCLLKDSSDVDLVASLREVVRGGSFIDPRVAQHLASDMIHLLRGRGEAVHLTPREREVLALLAEGCSNREIAARLFVAETTVKGHVGSLLDKLGARSRLEAVVRASERGLV